jgi:subtilisin family serine protease
MAKGAGYPLIFCLVIVSMVFVGCSGTAPAETPERPTEEPGPQPVRVCVANERDQSGFYPDNPGEIILLGQEADIRAYLAGLDRTSAEDVFSAEFDYQIFAERSMTERIVKIHLLKVSPEDDLCFYWDTMFDLLATDPPTIELPIFIAVNPLIGPAPSPCHDEKSGVIGDPNSVGARQLGDPIVAGADTTRFASQWAFAREGINLYDTTSSNAIDRLVDRSGSGKNIVFFDTSPFEEPGTHVIPLGLPGTEQLRLNVSHPALTRGIAFVSGDKIQHGLFGSALAYAVAPGSRIELVRVLEADGHGTLFDLLMALMHHTWQDMSKTVINLSLGVHSPKLFTPEQQQAIHNGLSQYKDHIDAEIWGFLSDSSATVDPDIIPSMSLFAVLKAHHAEGARIVAAAGNDSCDIDLNGETMLRTQMPASFPFVRSVMASNMQRGRACFSNMGDIAAPGGDALRSDGECDAMLLHDCNNGGVACDEIALISVTRNSGGNYDFAYWYGTSFAAPLVSGLEALALEQALSSADVISKSCPAATLGANIASAVAVLGNNQSNCPN